MLKVLLQQKTAPEIALALAARVRDKRKRRKMSQETLAIRTGVSLGSIKRFETSGRIALVSLIQIALVLDCQTEIEELFTQKQYLSIQEGIDENS